MTITDALRPLDTVVHQALFDHELTLRDREIPPEEARVSLLQYELDLLQWRIDVLTQIWTLAQTAHWPTAPGVDSIRRAN